MLQEEQAGNCEAPSGGLMRDNAAADLETLIWPTGMMNHPAKK